MQCPFRLARLKGLEPPTYWFVADSFSSFAFISNQKIGYIKPFILSTLRLFYHLFGSFLAHTCAKCAPKAGGKLLHNEWSHRSSWWGNVSSTLFSEKHFSMVTCNLSFGNTVAYLVTRLVTFRAHLVTLPSSCWLFCFSLPLWKKRHLMRFFRFYPSFGHRGKSSHLWFGNIVWTWILSFGN